jgi:trans-2,3-dihydro-3-hydroxyanthranilate isomerase
VPVTRRDRAWTLQTARAPETRPVEASRADLARMLGLAGDAIAGEPLWVNTGVEQLVIPVATAADVRAAQPVPDLLRRWGYSASRDEAMAYVWARDAADATTLTVRFFFTNHGSVVEDPATGSACANLGGWMLATSQPLPIHLTLRQGDAVHRPSRLDLRVATDRAIYVTGSVVELGRGTLDL